ncbi:hypothetical protein SAMN05192559_10298 [Halobacillus karajensis]|uniref:YkoP-like domain-containing protein n=1 Tax=Halobacillus karajensis TaxID=195088 RepID=A0A024P6K4_9BACI|nr:hypothetical protein [Halobacillus karajensis]CDQ18159.1 hypothetical protein BN982_00409 [Halobacillus karajensis]CDQ24510.1 hypothetical protein BN983_02794 [Halobacillus karajensis]CDQ29242.1 hypothetical protein BN981_03613 [Halobacillus karajensis]SEH58142.1 hypothetical protein SAMN05192559_10298 [Halobacillus karajensis]
MRIRLYFIALWKIVDPIYFSCTRLQHLGNKRNHPSIFRVRLTCYKGRDVTLSDGTVIKKNDVLLKIHLHNARLLHEFREMDSDLKKAMILYKKVKESFPHLACYLEQHRDVKDIKGIIGISVLNKGCERLGFDSYTISSPWYKWFKQLAHYPIYLLSTPKPYAIWKKRPSPKYLFMSKDRLLNKYGTSIG